MLAPNQPARLFPSICIRDPDWVLSCPVLFTCLDLSTTCTYPPPLPILLWMSILHLDQLPTLKQLYENDTLVHAPDVEDVEFPVDEEWLDRVSL